MTALQANPYADLMKPPDTPPTGANPYANLMQPPVVHPDAPSFADMVMEAVRKQEQQPAPEHAWYTNIGLGLVRGVFDIERMGNDLGQAATTQAKQLIGDHALLDAAAEQFKMNSAIARGINAKYLPMEHSIPGQIAEGAAPLAANFGIAIATGGESIPLQVAIFGAVGGAQQAAQSYANAKDANKSDDEALAEARVGGGIGAVVSAATGGALFAKIPGADKYLTSAVSKIATRAVIAGGVGEISGVTQRVTMDAWIDALRNEPDTALKLYNANPGYWGHVFTDALPGALTMALAGGATEGIKTLAEGKPLNAEDLAAAREDILRMLPPEKVPARDPDNNLFIKPSEMPLPTIADFVNERIETSQQKEASAIVDEMVKTKLDPESKTPLTEMEVARAQEVKSELDKLSTLPVAPEEGQNLPPKVQPTGESSAKTIKQRIREVVMGPKSMITMNEKALLSLSMRQQAKGARIAAASTARAAYDELRTRVLAERQTAKENLAKIEGWKKELITVAQQAFPGSDVPKPVLTQIGRAKTLGTFANGMRVIGELLAKQEHESAIQNLKDVIAKGNPEKMTSQFREAWNELTKNLDLTTLSDEKRAKLEALKGVDNLPHKTIAELERLDKTPIGNLDRQAATTIANELTSILEQSQEARKAARLADKGIVLNTQDALSQEIATTLGKDAIAPPGRVSPKLHILSWAHAGEATADTLSEFIGGHENSLTHAIMYDNLWRARNRAISGMYETMDGFKDFLKNLGLPVESKALSKWSALMSKNPDLIDMKLTSGKTIQMTRAQRVYLLASLLDHDFYDQVLFEGVPLKISGTAKGKTFGFTFEDAQALRQSASAEELKIAQRIFDEYNGPLKEKLRNWSEYNRYFDITKGKPYFTIHRAYEGKVPAQPTGDFRTFVAESSGLLKDRTGSSLPIEIRDAFAEFNNYTWFINGLSEMAPSIRLARQTMLQGAVSNLLTNAGHAQALKHFGLTLDNLTREFTGGSFQTPGFLQPIILKLMGNIGHSMIGNNPLIAAYHVAATAMLAQEIKPQYISLAVAERAMFSSEVAQRMRDGSPSLRLRADSSGAGMVFEGSSQRRPLFFMGKPSEPSMWMLNTVMEQNARVAWRAAELQAKAEGAGPERAQELAERAINRTQITYDPLNRTGWAHEASAAPLTRFFLMFRAQTGKMLSQIVSRGVRVIRGQGSLVGNIAAIANLTLGNAIVMSAIQEFTRSAVRGFRSPYKSPEEAEQAWGARILSHIANLVPGGSFIAAGINHFLFPKAHAFSPDISPVASAMNDGIAAFTGLQSDITSSHSANKVLDHALQLSEFIASVAGLPLVWPIEQLRQIIKANQSAPERRTGT